MSSISDYVRKDPITGRSKKKTAIILDKVESVKNMYDIVVSYENEIFPWNVSLNQEHSKAKEILSRALKNIRVVPVIKLVKFHKTERPFYYQIKRLKELNKLLTSRANELKEGPEFDRINNMISILNNIIIETDGKREKNI